MIHLLLSTSWNSFPMNSLLLSDRISHGVAIPTSISDSALIVSSEVLSLMKTMNGYCECRSIAVRAVPNSQVHCQSCHWLVWWVHTKVLQWEGMQCFDATWLAIPHQFVHVLTHHLPVHPWLQDIHHLVSFQMEQFQMCVHQHCCYQTLWNQQGIA